MKTQHRLMKIVEIENNYQKHRERLLSIQHINSRKKQSIANIKPNQASTAYKKNKLQADIFSYKAKHEQIQHENLILLNKIEKQYGKPGEKKPKLSLSRSQSSRSARSMHSLSSIKDQNVRIYQKINNTKSIYSKMRGNSSASGVKLNTSKEQVMHLLVNQLGVKPSVLFPTLPNKIKPSKSIHNKTLDLKEDKTIRNTLNELMRRKHNATNSHLSRK